MVFSLKKNLSRIILIIFILGIGFWLFYYLTTEKTLQIISPNGKEILEANKTYQITWKARKIGKIGIMLVEEEDSRKGKWIVRDISADKERYDWQIFTWEKPSQNYKIAIFEYPWQEKNKIDYSDNFFTILGPKFASCDSLSIEHYWPFVPNDYPNLKRVFITKNTWQGNLEGLEGADKKCQAEAEEIGFQGNWKAFLGDDDIMAVERLNLEGIFIEAKIDAILPEGKTCHRLLGKNFDDFFKNISQENFLTNFQEVWLGRINKESKKECIFIPARYYKDVSENYSFTSTCQNWTVNQAIVPGYPPKEDEKKEFPLCYTPEGKKINAIFLGGYSSGFIESEKKKFITFSIGKFCNVYQRLLCIQQ